MFDNEMDPEHNEPICPICEFNVEPRKADGTMDGDAFKSNKGFYIAHKVCANNVNRLARGEI